MSAFRRQAEAEAEEVRSWTCQSCDTMVETEGEHCRACAAYWADVRSGLFEDMADFEDDEW